MAVTAPPTSKPSRLRGALRAALLGVFGRPIVCAECGRTIFRCLPIAWRGRLRLVGARGSLVRVAFVNQELVEFRHVAAGDCPVPERPWVQ